MKSDLQRLDIKVDGLANKIDGIKVSSTFWARVLEDNLWWLSVTAVVLFFAATIWKRI